jgi:predicted dinucleotide-binding enzyme
VIAVPWEHVPDAVNGLDWDGVVLIDVTNANTLGADVLAADPDQAGGQRVIFIAGDDDDAKAARLRAAGQLFQLTQVISPDGARTYAAEWHVAW